MKDLLDFLLENGPGTNNEEILLKQLKKALRGRDNISVVFVADNKRKRFNNIVAISDVSRDTRERKKADLLLLSPVKQYPISLKADTSDYWESADSFWGGNARQWIDNLVAKGDLKLTKMQAGYYEMSQSFAVRATGLEAKDVVFGTDILPHGVVIKRSFNESDFSMNGNVLTINCTSVIDSLDDIVNTPDEVWFFVRRDPGRNVKALGYNGIRVLASNQRRIAAENILKYT